MLSHISLLVVALAYVSLLFAIAYYGDKRAEAGRSLIANPYVYTLSIAVYCTAWTFYGSVGLAASSGVQFLPIYLGPTLMAVLWWFVLLKIIRISKAQRITSIADFIGSRYGKSALLGGLVTVIAVVGIMPYFALQLKAISTSYFLLGQYPAVQMPTRISETPIWADTALYVALALAAFTILFGARHTDVSERHEGLVAAVAFESLVKLVAFISVGLFVTFSLFDGPGDLFARAAERPELAKLMTMDAAPGSYVRWCVLTFLAMSAIMFLPRQFQVAVVENVNEAHVRRAAWLFPLYLLLINLFVLPLALGGLLSFPEGQVDPDTFVLTLPMVEQREMLALLAFIGGMSAASGMVIVASIALSTMVSNDLVVPALLRFSDRLQKDQADFSRLLLKIRRGTIIGLLLLGYCYFRLTGESYALASIGLVSFCAAAQFAPPILIGLYWKAASRRGALTGLFLGFTVWVYTLLLPGLARSGWIPAQFLEHGLFGVAALNPQALFGLDGLDPITHSVFWSMLLNVGGLVAVSLFDRPSALERIQARHFVDVFRESGPPLGAWHGTATVAELSALVERFLGTQRASAEFARYRATHGLDDDGDEMASTQFVSHAERLLAGSIGSASARIMVSSVVQGEEVSLEGVMEILDETSQVMEYSRELELKSTALQAATEQLRAANERLTELDRLKDDFVSTVSHELRTPLTSIRAFSEILQRNPELAPDKRQEFLDIIVRETARLTRLINDVLDLAKIDSGQMDWSFEEVDLGAVVREALAAVSQIFDDRSVHLECELPPGETWVHADPDRITQVLINLLSNAGKFCQENRGEVTVKLRADDRSASVEVQDNGSGIAPEQRARVFDKFHQITDNQESNPKGTGLGLAISQRIVEHHDGRIWCEGATEGGTKFTFQLPIRRDREAAA